MPTTTEMTGRSRGVHDCFAPSSYDQLESSYEGTGQSSTQNVHTIPSGLSALIRAATAQLSELIEEERVREIGAGGTNAHHKHDSNYTYASGGTTSDDGASSDGGEQCQPSQSKPNSVTPLMVPENTPSDLGGHPHKPQSFPEILMSLAVNPINEDTIAFLPDGKFFALRSHKFTKELLLHNFEDFPCQTFEEFLILLHDWGFSRILHQEDSISNTRNSNIEVYRHPKFVKGDWKQCATIRFGESPTNARLSALPDRVLQDYSTAAQSQDAHPSEDVSASSQGLAKRRLSPTSYRETRRDSDFTTATTSSHHSHKKRLSLDGSAAAAAAAVGDELSVANTTISRSDEIRSVALALTAEKLNLKSSGGDVRNDSSNSATTNMAATPLVDQAVKSATHTIVTDAIETLLNDEIHTKATYQKHAEELSRSSLPGVVPISKQLFEPPSTQQQDLCQVSTGQTENPPNHIYTSDTTAEEAASVIVEVAIAAQEQARQDELAAAAAAAAASKPAHEP